MVAFGGEHYGIVASFLKYRIGLGIVALGEQSSELWVIVSSVVHKGFSGGNSMSP